MSDSQKVTLSIRSIGGGSTSPGAGSYEYASGVIVAVTAIPDGGCFLDHWILDGATPWGQFNDANPVFVTMNRDHELTAVFDVVSFKKPIWIRPARQPSSAVPENR